jgi:molecular chaperone GrpE
VSKKEEMQEEVTEEQTIATEQASSAEQTVDSEATTTNENEVEQTESSEVEKVKAELAEMEDKFLRARAEIANMSNRFKNERELLVRYRSQDLGKKILPSIDNLERALAIETTDEQEASLKKGISMVLESLNVALKEEGIEEIPAMGEAFDPTLHQAVQTVPASEETPADTIVEVLQKGYKLQDRVLRPSMVIVAQ